jgi:hypothetical protein
VPESWTVHRAADSRGSKAFELNQQKKKSGKKLSEETVLKLKGFHEDSEF